MRSTSLAASNTRGAKAGSISTKSAPRRCSWTLTSSTSGSTAGPLSGTPVRIAGYRSFIGGPFMCLILLAWKSHPEYPLVFAGNRDERYDRPSATADFWKDAPEIFGGRDLELGGTWLGLRRNGRFAAITNYRDGPAKKPAPRSRGELTANFLRGNDGPAAYMNKVATVDGCLYGGYTLLAGDRE